MRKVVGIVVVLMMVFTFGIAVTKAQQTDSKNHGAMIMGADCPMVAKAASTQCSMCQGGKCGMAQGGQCHMAQGGKCPMAQGGKCAMAAEKCPMHQASAFTAPDKGAP